MTSRNLLLQREEETQEPAASGLAVSQGRKALLAREPRIFANDDAQAVSQWLAEYRDSPQTFRAYRKEAERLLLWLEGRGEGLRDLRRNSLDEYERFLADPQPAHRWIGPPRPRQSLEWRPFRGPLTAASRRQSLVILQGMFAWLVEAGWLDHNPFRLMRGKRRKLDNRTTTIERYLEQPLWAWLWRWLERPVDENATAARQLDHVRRRFVFGFAYLLAPRLHEMAAARMNDFYRREGYWWWRVVGKGDKLAEIPLPPDMLRLLIEWREVLHLPAYPDGAEDSPLLRTLDGQRALGDNQLYRMIRTTFRDAADALEREGEAPESACHLRRATPHWLRHTALTHQAQAGVELRYLAKTARHARLDTTARYLHAEAQEWQQQLARHKVVRPDESPETL
ncbi:hypothetical protein GCM10027040_28250 [Halomonas shantousis]